MTDKRLCPQCGTELSPDAVQGLCPKCLLDAGLHSQPQDHPSVGTRGESPPPDPTSKETIPPEDSANDSFPSPHLEALARQFPQLEILELLGRGGMGVVYKARQRRLNRLVAVKVLPPRIAGDPAFAERFTREAQALARLNHPNIVQVYDFGQTDEFFYFVMEYVDGLNLRALIHDGKLMPEKALTIVPQICEALQFAHDEGIVHRDIKPENVLLDKKGRVKIADFGLAKLLDQSPENLSLTGTGQLMGTLGYMAPEQLQQAHAVDHRADIYSLGVVFYEMLTGELPIGRFDPPSKKVQVDVRLDEVVLRSLESEPTKRYQHANDVKTDLERVSYDNAVPNDATPSRATAAADVSGALAPGRVPRLVAIAMSYVFLILYGCAGIGLSIYGVMQHPIASTEFWTYVPAGFIAASACVYWMIVLRRWYRQVAETGTYESPRSSPSTSKRLRWLPFIGAMLAVCGFVFVAAVVMLAVVLAIQPTGTSPAGTPIFWEVIGFALFMSIAGLGPGLALWNQYRWIERGTPAMEEPEMTWFDHGLHLAVALCIVSLVILPWLRETDSFDVVLMFAAINTPLGLGMIVNRFMIRRARQEELNAR